MEDHIHLLSLDFDVWGHIIEALLTSNQSSQHNTFWVSKRTAALQPLSLACKRLRSIVSHWLFHDLHWPGALEKIYSVVQAPGGADYAVLSLAGYPPIPHTILPYVRRLLVKLSGETSLEPLAWALPHMPRLSHCSCDLSGEPPFCLAELLHSLSLHPTFESLHLIQTPLISNTNLTCQFPRLVHLLIKPASGHVRVNGGIMMNAANLESALGMMGSDHTFLDVLVRDARSRFPMESLVSSHLITTNLSSLRSLEIDGVLFPWTGLRDLQWPSLQTLIFTGTLPFSTVPVVTLLTGMSGLRDLQFRWVLETNNPFYILPPGTSSLSWNTLVSLFPVLRSLTLSNPDIGDLCYSVLPSSLEYIHFPVISSKNEVGVGLSTTQARKLVHLISRSHATILGIQLLLHKGFVSSEIVQYIAVAFPSLKSLDIGVIFYRPTIRNAPREAYLESLMPLQHLTALRLGCSFNSNSREGWLGVHEEEAKWAMFLAQGLPKLEYVTFQSIASRPDGWTHPEGWIQWNNWTRYDVIRADADRRLSVLWNDAALY